MVKNLPASGGATGDAGLILGGEDPLEKDMATHSSILAWEIPQMEEPGEVPSTGSQSVMTEGTEHMLSTWCLSALKFLWL